jgi:acylphosphatase
VKRLEIRVRGLVQGVFFRASTQRKALDLGVAGTVRNEPDGSVLVDAEGPPGAVDELLAWCRRGPARARVDRVDVVEREPCGLAGFEITG